MRTPPGFLLGASAILCALGGCSSPPAPADGDVSSASTQAVTASQATGPQVSLLRAESYVYSPEIVEGTNVPTQNMTFSIQVAHFASQADVWVHLRGADGTWGDWPATLIAPLTPALDLWTVSISTATLFDPVFVVGLDVAGQTSWDNNGGANYALGRNDGVLLNAGNVLLDSALVMGTNPVLNQDEAGGFIDIRNLAYAKDVSVVYSIDGWATVQTTAASFVGNVQVGYGKPVAFPNAEGFELWQFGIPPMGTATSVQLAIAYTVDGVTYWDNNFGQNYTVTTSGANGAANRGGTLGASE